MRNILIVEDDIDTNSNLRILVERLDDIEVTQAYDLQAGLKHVTESHFDVAIVDIELGPKDRYGGLAILAKLSGTGTATLVVSGAAEDIFSEVTIALDAYDFIAKPIKEASFLNKLNHALRATVQQSSENGNQGPKVSVYPEGLIKDPLKQYVYKWHGERVSLTITQVRLLACLIESPGETVPYSVLLSQLDSTNSKSALATHISGIRSKFRSVDDRFAQIDTDPGKGYVWKTSK
jgi:DNA-binding response OmpR family regulator